MAIKNFNIDFDKINLCGRKDKEESFENLCKEFLVLKYQVTENVNLIKWYPAIECPVINWVWWLYYGFQAKLLLNTTSLNSALEESFWSTKSGECKINEDDLEKIQILVIFSNKEKTNKTKGKLDVWIKKTTLIIEFRCGKDFISELQKDEFLSITVKYFDNQDLRKSFHENHKKPWKVQSLIDVAKLQIIENHEYAFDWEYITQVEKDLAREYQEEFLLNKRLYCDTPSLEVFMELEKKIINTKFKWLERWLKWRRENDVEWIYERFENDLFSPSWEIDDKDKIDILAYTPEKDHRRWLLVNLWAEWNCSIEAHTEKVVRFISKAPR